MRMPRTAILAKAMAAYCKRVGASIPQIRFFCRGQRLRPERTPAHSRTRPSGVWSECPTLISLAVPTSLLQLGMRDDDEIDAIMQRGGPPIPDVQSIHGTVYPLRTPQDAELACLLHLELPPALVVGGDALLWSLLQRATLNQPAAVASLRLCFHPIDSGPDLASGRMWPAQ